MFAKRREVETTFGILHGQVTKTLLCLAADVVEKDLTPAAKEWRGQLALIESSDRIDPTSDSSQTQTPFDLEEWLEGDTDEYDMVGDKVETRVPHRTHDSTREIPAMDDSRAMLYTCASCGNVSALLSQCVACKSAKYCDAVWCVSCFLLQLCIRPLMTTCTAKRRIGNATKRFAASCSKFKREE